MIHPLYHKFKELFPDLGAKVINYGRAGKHSIRMALDDHRILIFGYQDDKTWKLETLHQFVEEQ